ncbi:hypothetical protein SASPL_121353 [Salvia splendens]|uniref:Pistil-specific extensin-like protein n=1 Tax=Salvia splendens TaxID=180675 RepID=A0A8X8ZWH3_SALSN|nr:pistil-specific extensin-like protein [Salvia splendens]KAG6419141.1 hypothetical protein SASPL_121353 [Salvia splendens]
MMPFVSVFTSFVLSLLLTANATLATYPPPAQAPHPSPSPHHHHPPAPAPAPSHPPVRKMVAIQGVVYCKSCKYRGVDTLIGATPLAGAVVKLQCNNSKTSMEEKKTSDKNGYFFFMPQKLTTSGSHKCKVFLISSPSAACNVPTNLHGGALGALLRKPVEAPPKPLPFELFTVGPFAFEAAKKLPCHY